MSAPLQFACMDVVQRWLDGSQNFIVGRTYYKKFGADKKLQQLFNNGETPFAKAELIKALRALITEEKKEVKQPAKEEHLDIMPKGTDDISIAIELEWRPLYQKMKYLIHQLDNYGTDNSEKVREECRLISEEILFLEQQCMKCWHKLDEYIDTGKLPEIKEEKFVVPDDPVQLGITIQSIKKNIRRNKNKAKKNPDNPLYPAKVAMYELQLQLAMQSQLIKPKI